MVSEIRDVVLTKSQAACLAALRSGKSSLARIVMTAALTAKTATVALAALEAKELAERDPKRVWRATSHGETCLVRLATSGGATDVVREPSPNGRRLMKLLERPTEGRTIAKKLGVSRQGALNIMHRLFAQGRIKFADPEDLSWWVMRADDETPLLTRDEERVLSAIPGEYCTSAVKIRRRTKLGEDEIAAALDRLVSSGFVEPAGEFNGAALFRATAAGLGHPQVRPDIRAAEPPHLPVYSDRVRTVLSAIETGGALRIRDVKGIVGLPQQSINALMQYLKRKRLVQKTGEFFEDPYVLTAMGRITLAEMARPGQMKSGYPKGAVEPVREYDGVAPRRDVRVGVTRRPKSAKDAVVKLPRLPVRSDRIQSVLSVISEAGVLRIKEIGDRLRLPPQSANALMQYLKRKALVRKTGEHPADPYALTEMGQATLSEMAQRRAA